MINNSISDLVPEVFLHAHLSGLQLAQNSWPEQLEIFPERSAVLGEMLPGMYCKPSELSHLFASSESL